MDLETFSINTLLKNKDAKTLKKVICQFSPFEIAQIVGNKVSEEQQLIFSVLSKETAIKTFAFLPKHTQLHLLKVIEPGQAAAILEDLSSGERVDYLQELPRAVVDELVKRLPHDERMFTLTLLGYPEDTVGRIMTSDYMTVGMDWSIESVLNHILQFGHETETMNTLYVVDEDSKLLDTINIRKLLFAPRNATVNTIADHKVETISVYAKVEEAFALMKKYDRLALPVVDEEGILLGVITNDDLLQFLNEEATSDIQKIGGSEALDEPYMETPFLSLMRKRAGWLTVLFIGEMLTTTAMTFFEDTISRAVVLALFLPLIISSGGNAGSQASTLIIRAMALGEVRLKDWWTITKRELASGLFLGVTLAIVGFTRVSLWSTFSDIYGPHWLMLAWTIAAALVGVVLVGTLFGAILPIALRRFKLDPATCSAPFVATFVDVTGVLIYFFISIIILRGTLL